MAPAFNIYSLPTREIVVGHKADGTPLMLTVHTFFPEGDDK